MFDEYRQFERFRNAWNAVRIERQMEYSLFTFGDSELPYYLVTKSQEQDAIVRIRQGQVNITRPRIITPDSMRPELRDFLDSQEEQGLIEFLMMRTAAFSNLRVSNHKGVERIVTDTLEEAVARLGRQLDAEEEDRTAILSAPHNLAGFAVLRYASEKILSSASGNIQELRERGLLP